MRRSSILLLAALGWAGLAAADPADPESDSCGIYFDEGAESWCATAGVGTQVTAYLCLTRPSFAGDIGGWEARVEISAGAALSAFALRGDAINTSTAPEFRVAFGTPVAPALSLVLVQLTIDVAPDYPIALRVWPHSSPSWVEGTWPLPLYSEAGNPATYHSLGYSWGWTAATGVPHWCAGVNNPDCPDGPTRTEERTWGSLRALFR